MHLAGRRITASNFGLFGDLERVIHLNAKVSDRLLELQVPKEQLDRAQILGPPVDQGRLRAPYRVRPVVGAIQPQFVDPIPEDSGVVTGPEMGRVVEPAGQQVALRLPYREPDPRLHGVSRAGVISN